MRIFSYFVIRCFPHCFSAHVLSEDTIYRQIKDGKLYSKRLLTKTNKLPKWGEFLISSRIVKIMEESIVDPNTRTLTTHTKNLGFQSVMVSVSIDAFLLPDTFINKLFNRFSYMLECF